MKGLDNPVYLIMWIASNLVAILFVLAAVKRPKTARLLFFLLFGWACWMNFTTSQNSPQDYLQYADLAMSSWYSELIRGWFSKNTKPVVGLIAACQGLIAMSMLLKGWVFKLGCTGGIVFLVSIAPLGTGSGFPCTLIFAAALVVLFSRGEAFWWTKKSMSSIHY